LGSSGSLVWRGVFNSIVRFFVRRFAHTGEVASYFGIRGWWTTRVICDVVVRSKQGSGGT